MKEVEAEPRTVNIAPTPSGLFSIFDRLLTGIIVELDGPHITNKRRRAIQTQLRTIRSEIIKYPKLFHGLDWDDMARIPEMFKKEDNDGTT